MGHDQWEEMLDNLVEELAPHFEASTDQAAIEKLDERMMNRILNTVVARIASARSPESVMGAAGVEMVPVKARACRSGPRHRDAATLSGRASRSVRRSVGLRFEELEPRNAPCFLTPLGACSELIWDTDFVGDFAAGVLSSYGQVAMVSIAPRGSW